VNSAAGCQIMHIRGFHICVLLCILPISLSVLCRSLKTKNVEMSESGKHSPGHECQFSVENVKGDGHWTSRTSRNCRISGICVYIWAATQVTSAQVLTAN